MMSKAQTKNGLSVCEHAQASWREVKLGKVGTVITGKTPSQKNLEDWGSKMLFITPSDYKNYRKFAYSSDRKLSQIGIDRLENKILPSNSVMVTCIGSDMGKVAINKYPVVTNQQINSVIPDQEMVDSSFLYHLLVDMYELLRIYGTAGTAVPIVNKRDFENIGIEIPPLPEQKAIAEVLSSLDDKIDLLHRQNKTLEDIAQALFRKWFVEEADEEWEESCLSEIAKHKKVNIKPDKNPNVEYHHYSIPAFDNVKNPIAELGSEIKSNKYKVFDSSILISKLNPRFPRVWSIYEEAESNAICSTEFQVVYPKDKKYFSFIYCFLKSRQVTKELISAAGGTSGSHQRILPQDILNLSYLNPPLEMVEKFSVITNDYWKKISNNSSQIRTLKNLRGTLLPKLMSGVVRVKI